jgi:uncharacterized membrane protein
MLSLQSSLTSYCARFSFVGLVFAVLAFAASLSPSLLPRHYLVQGLLTGLSTAVGYGIGVFFVWLWHYLEIPDPSEATQRVGRSICVVVVTITAVVFLWRATVWQNSIRTLMELEPVESAYPLSVAAIAVFFAILLVAAGRFVASCWHYFAVKFRHKLPRRVANVLSVVLVATLIFFFTNRILARLCLTAADAVFLKVDTLIDDGVQPPVDTLATGSKDSLIPWDSIGRQGKDFITLGPTRKDISQFTGQTAQQPLRIYAGLNTSDTFHERAQLALAELQRVNAFDRCLLVIATPTGTGWLDPAAVDSLEYLHRGDTAIVSMQYSYLPSWITILVDPQRSEISARHLFQVVYDYWKTLPKDNRPKLYLHGLSLGSLGSEVSADLLTVFEDPIQGAVWSGPPFPSTRWAALTRDRNPDSPAWLPKYRDGRMIRFTARENALAQPGAKWGPLRLVYVQHASDPMVFFAPNLAWHRPAWLDNPRGPDVSPYLTWYPMITFLQVAFDLPMATSVPLGYGHNYAPAGYIHAWREVTAVAGWSDADCERLAQHLTPP